MSLRSKRRHRLAVPAFFALASLFACSKAAPAPDRAPPVPSAWPHFAVRGRWNDPRALTYHIETENGPLSGRAFTGAIERALEAWWATGLVEFTPAREGDPAWITFGWRRGRHEDAHPFGVDSSVAHSGPVRRGTFVHFDAARDWSVDGGEGESVLRTALHEIGHVLGLGHSTDPAAAMHADAQVDELGRSDLAGLRSLYPGAAPGPSSDPSDLHLRRIEPDGSPGDLVALPLLGVAPPDRSGFALFDTEGDGDDELLVWRTDMEAYGAMMIYHFGRGPDSAPRLELTVGPLLGMVAPQAERVVVEAIGDERSIYSTGEYGSQRVQFDQQGLPGQIQEIEADDVPEEMTPTTGDVDTDGRREIVVRPGA